MKKSVSLSNQGFMLIETILVSLTVTGILIYMYVQFSTINDSYRSLSRYNTVEGLYKADVVKQFLLVNTSKKQPQNTSLADPLYDSLGNGRKIATCNNVSCECTYNATTRIGIPTTANRNPNKVAYFCEMVKLLELKYVILAPSSADYNTIKSSVTDINPAVEDFMKVLKPGATDFYRIIIEYNDGSFASLLYEPLDM